MFYTEFLFQSIMVLSFFQTIFSAPDLKGLKMLDSLTFDSNTIVRNKEIQVHVTIINKPIERLLFFEQEAIMSQEGTHLLFKVRRTTLWTTDALHVASRALPEFSMLLSVPILLMADDADLFMVINILCFAVVVYTIVDFVGSSYEFFCIQLDVSGAHWASVACKNVLGCHPEFSVFLADDENLINGNCVIDFGEIVFVAMNGCGLPNELVSVAGNLLTAYLSSAMRATDAF